MKKRIIVFVAFLCIALIIVTVISKLPDNSIAQQPTVSDTEAVSNNNDADVVEEDNSPDELPIIPEATGEDDSDLSEQADEEQIDESSDAEESPVDEDIQSSEPIPQQGIELGDDELPILP